MFFLNKGVKFTLTSGYLIFASIVFLLVLFKKKEVFSSKYLLDLNNGVEDEDFNAYILFFFDHK